MKARQSAEKNGIKRILECWNKFPNTQQGLKVIRVFVIDNQVCEIMMENIVRIMEMVQLYKSNGLPPHTFAKKSSTQFSAMQ